MNGFDLSSAGPTLVQPHAAPYLLQIPVHAGNLEEAMAVAGAVAIRAAMIAPDHADARTATIITTEERTECLLICGQMHWSGRRCGQPYGHKGVCPDPS